MVELGRLLSEHIQEQYTPFEQTKGTALTYITHYVCDGCVD